MDIASLGLRIETGDLKSAIEGLNKLPQAARNAEAAEDNLAKASKKFSDAIDAQVGKLQQAAIAKGLSAREAKLLELGLAGASKAQLEAANTAIKLSEAYDKGTRIADGFKTAIKSIAAASVAAAVAGYAALNKLAESASTYQDVSERIGDTAEAVSSLQLALDTSGRSLDQAANFSVRLTKALASTDDESKLVARGLAAIGLSFDDIKKQSPVTQLESIAKALKGFDAGPGKTAALEAIVKGGSNLLPFFNDLGDATERQNRLTNEQIQVADEVSKAHARQASILKGLGEQIAVSVLPSITDLVGGFKDAISEAANLNKGASDLQRNKAIGDWADEAVRSFAAVVDFSVTLIKALSLVGSAARAVFEDIALLKSVSLTGLTSLFNPTTSAEGIGNLKAQLAERNKVIADFNVKLDKFLSGSTTAVGDAVNRRIAARKAQIDQASSSPTKGPVPTAGLSNDKPLKSKREKGAVTDQDILKIDLARAKRQMEELTNVYRDAESILEAQRSAGLVDENQYYQAKASFIRLNSDAQEAALQREIATLKESLAARKGTDKQQLENQGKLEEAEGRLQSLRNRSAAALQVNAIQSDAALKKIQQGFRDAEDAATAYLETLRRGQQRELAGFGAGAQERDRTSGRAQIEDKYAAQLQDLEKSRRDAQLNSTFGPEAQKKYNEELDRIRRFKATALGEYDDYFKERLAKEADFSLGAQEAFQNYIDNASKTAKQTEDLFTHAFGSMEDALVQFVQTGKLDFKGLVNSILADIARIAVRQATAKGLEAIFSAFGGGGFSFNGGVGTTNAAGISGGRANGGPVSPGRAYEINERGRPEILSTGGRDYLMMGADGGRVTPQSSGAGAQPIVVQNSFTIQGTTDRRSQSQIAAAAGQGVRRAVARNT